MKAAQAISLEALCFDLSNFISEFGTEFSMSERIQNVQLFREHDFGDTTPRALCSTLKKNLLSNASARAVVVKSLSKRQAGNYSWCGNVEEGFS